MSSRPKKTHDDYRKVCCLFCLRKGESASDRPLSEREIELVITHFYFNFKMFQEYLPLGCCGTCRKNLSYRFGKTPKLESYKPFPCESDDQFYQNIVYKLQELPRGSGTNTDCTCFICEQAHGVLVSAKLKPGIPKPEFSSEVSRDYRNLDKSRVDDVTEMMGKLTPKTKDALVVARIKEKQDLEHKTAEDPLSFHSATGGAPVQVITGTKAKKKLLYDNKAPVAKSTFEAMAAATDISNKKAKIIAKEFRASEGKTSIEAGFEKTLAIEPAVIKKYFTTKYIDLEVIKEKVVVKDRKKIVYCHHLPGYTTHVKEERGITEDVAVDQKIGIDGGGGFFKVCLNIIARLMMIQADDLKEPPKKKPMKSAFKDGGVKKLLILVIVQDIAETYFNAKTILNLLHIEKIDFVIATDYKLCNILLGLSTHSSKYRCPYCKLPYDEFCNHRREILQSDLRTLGDIREWHRKFKEHCEWNYPTDPSKGKKDAMDFYNCIEEPLFNMPDDTYIWDILPLFELHLRFGFINR